MPGPGGKEVGRVSVRATPDTSKFPEELREDLKRLEKSLKLEIPVKLVVDEVKEELKKVKESTKREKVEIDLEVDGDGAVRETRRIKNLIQKAVGAINLWANIDMAKSLATIKAQIKIIDKAVKAYKISIPMDLVSWGRILGYATALAAVLVTIPHIVGAIGGALSIVGGLLATLPALAAGAAIGITALVVGTQGFFEALGNAGDAAAFEESLKKLTPSAQAAARALAEFREPLAEIKAAVQERLFAGMDESFRKLKDLLPVVKSGLAGTANGIRGMAQAWIDMASTQSSQDDLRKIFFGVNQGLKAMEPVIANIGLALKDFAVVGSSFFIEWGAGLTDVTAKFAKWSAEARKTGEMREWIENAVEKLKQMGRIIADVWAGFSNISEAMRGGREFLDILEDMTQSFREFTEESEVQKAFQNIGKVLSQIVDVGSDVFGELFRTIGRVLQDAMPFIQQFVHVLGVVLMAIIRTLGPMLQGLARFFSENKEVVVPLVIALIGLVTAFKLAATAAKGVQGIADSIDAMKAAKDILGGVAGDFKKMAKAAMASVASAVTAAARWVWAWTQIAAQAAVNAAKASAAWVASAVKSAAFTARYYAIMVAQAIANFVKMAVAAVVNAARTAAAWIAGWVAMAAAATANAIRMAAAWLIAMGPVGWIIAAIVALVALIVMNWDTIRNKTVEIWNAIWKFVSDVLTEIRDWCYERLMDVVGFFVELPGKIGDALGNLWDIITGAFEGPINWVKGIISDLADAWAEMFGDINRGFKGGKLQTYGGLFKKDGGPVVGGTTYIANEEGFEGFTDGSGQMFLMAGPMGAFTPPESGQVTSHRDLARSLIPLTANNSSESSNIDFEGFMERLATIMSGWAIELDPTGVTRMVNKTNLMNKRR